MSGVTEFYGFEFNSRSDASPSLNSSQRCFKYALVAVNCVFLVFGCVLCALGAYAVNSQAGALAGATLPDAIIVLGVFTIILSFLGCGSSYFESRVALSVYFAVLLLICLLSFVVGIGILVEKNQSSSLLIQGWAATPALGQQTLMEAFGCCGFISYCDKCVCSSTVGAKQIVACTNAQCLSCTAAASPANTTAQGLNCPAGSSPSSPVCLSALQSSFNQYYQQAGGASIAFGVLMFAAMLVVCVLMRAIKQKAYLEDVRAQHRRIREAKEEGGAASIDLMGVRTGLEEAGTGAGRRAGRIAGDDMGGELESGDRLPPTSIARMHQRAALTRDDEEEEADEDEEEEEAEQQTKDAEDEDEVMEEDEEEDMEEEEEEEPVPPPRSQGGRGGRPAPPPPPPPPRASPPRRNARSRRDESDFS